MEVEMRTSIFFDHANETRARLGSTCESILVAGRTKNWHDAGLNVELCRCSNFLLFFV